MRALLLSISVAVASSSACGGDGNEKSELVGAWFKCSDGSPCTDLTDEGTLFRADNNYAWLQGVCGGTYNLGKGFCESPHAGECGTYTFDGTTLVRTSKEGKVVTLTVTINGDRLEFDPPYDGEKHWKRVVDPSAGVCALPGEACTKHNQCESATCDRGFCGEYGAC